MTAENPLRIVKISAPDQADPRSPEDQLLDVIEEMRVNGVLYTDNGIVWRLYDIDALNTGAPPRAERM